MSDIRNCRKIAGIMLAVILLTFFCVVQEKLPIKTASEIVCVGTGITIAVAGTDADTNEMPGQESRITASKGTYDEFVTREQKAVRVIPIRFIAIVCALFDAIWVMYRVTIRRFGCRMIVLWENIHYIHEIDGAKGKDLLYT